MNQVFDRIDVRAPRKFAIRFAEIHIRHRRDVDDISGSYSSMTLRTSVFCVEIDPDITEAMWIECRRLLDRGQGQTERGAMRKEFDHFWPRRPLLPVMRRVSWLDLPRPSTEPPYVGLPVPVLDDDRSVVPKTVFRGERMIDPAAAGDDDRPSGIVERCITGPAVDRPIRDIIPSRAHQNRLRTDPARRLMSAPFVRRTIATEKSLVFNDVRQRIDRFEHTPDLRARASVNLLADLARDPIARGNRPSSLRPHMPRCSIYDGGIMITPGSRQTHRHGRRAARTIRTFVAGAKAFSNIYLCRRTGKSFRGLVLQHADTKRQRIPSSPTFGLHVPSTTARRGSSPRLSAPFNWSTACCASSRSYDPAWPVIANAL